MTNAVYTEYDEGAKDSNIKLCASGVRKMKSGIKVKKGIRTVKFMSSTN